LGIILRKYILKLENSTFKLILDREWKVGNLLQDHVEQRYLKVLTEPIHKYYKWYHKLLNKITLGYRFNEGYEYTVESVPKKLKIGLL